MKFHAESSFFMHAFFVQIQRTLSIEFPCGRKEQFEITLELIIGDIDSGFAKSIDQLAWKEPARRKIPDVIRTRDSPCSQPLHSGRAGRSII